MSDDSDDGYIPPGILDLPSELLSGCILQSLPLKDLARMAGVNKFFHELVSEESLWRDLTQRDFAFSPTLLAPPPAPFFKRLYIGMSSPQPFVWGSSDRSRLGNASDPRYPLSVRSRRNYIDTPARLDITDGGMTWSENLQRDIIDAFQTTSGTESTKAKDMSVGASGKRRVAVVEMVAGGWSFAARDQTGMVYVWGQLDGGQFGNRSPSWSDKYCQVPEPTKIPLPCRAEQIASGRNHLLILDSYNLVWELRSWGRAYYHTAPSLTSPNNRGAASRPHHILQISAGWSHSACLTSSGDIHLWFPFSNDYTEGLTPDDRLDGPLSNPSVPEEDKASREVKWGKVGGSIVRQLTPIPERPDIDAGQDQELQELKAKKDDEWDQYLQSRTDRTVEEGQKIVKIASGRDFLVALRANGEVWVCSAKDQELGDWVYLPWFSGPEIKHITAQFESVTSYPAPAADVPGRINHAKLVDFSQQTTDGTRYRPVPLPALDGKSIIQVAHGDHHHVALTSKGQVYTWGEGSNGQLGLGDGRHRAEEPRKVTFAGDDEDNETFIFGITAGGWHTGALALGSQRLDRSREKSRVAKEEVSTKEREDESEERGGMREMSQAEQGQGQRAGQGIMGGTILGAPFFRVGFAGRGGQVGGGGGRGGVPGQAGEGTQRSWFRGLRWNRGGGDGTGEGSGSGSGSGSGAGPSS